jgi:phosphoglycolate phosphatase
MPSKIDLSLSDAFKDRDMRSHVIFDFNGVIVDTLSIQKAAVEMISQKFGMNTRSFNYFRFLSFSGLLAHDIFLRMGASPRQAADMADLYIDYNRRHIEHVKIYPGILNLLCNLKEGGANLHICTGKDSRRTCEILDYLNIRKYFSAVVCGDEVSSGKPNPEMIWKIQISCPNFELENSVMVGDGANDISMARAAGIRAIGVTWGELSSERVSAESPDLLVRSPDELQRALGL